MTSPSTPPGRAPGSTAPPGGPVGPRRPRSPLAIAAGVVVGLALVIALAADRSTLLAPTREGRTDRGSLLVTVVVVAGATLLVALLVATVVHRAVLARRPGAPTLRSTLLRSVPIACALAALVSLLAISWTRLDPEPGSTSEVSETTVDGGVEGGYRRAGQLLAGDFDGDGLIDLGVDLDGDGSMDRLVLPRTGGERGSGEAELAGDGVVEISCPDQGPCRAAVDLDGDGEVDQRLLVGRSLADLDAGQRQELRGRYRSTDDLFDEGRPTEDPDDPDDGGTIEAVPGDTTPFPDDAEPDAREDEEEDGGPSVLGPIFLLLLGVLVAAALVAVVVAAARSGYGRRRGRGAPGAPAPADPDAEQVREQMVASVDRSIEEMLVDPDPRTAIIGAYARLLEGLASGGVARHPHEAPIEHLQRALGLLSVRPEPLRVLIGRFEVARFSTHALGEADRVLALDALRAASQDLAAARPPAPVATAGAPR